MKKVFWFSRHDMSPEQSAALERALGPIEITKVNGTAPTAFHPFEGEVNNGPKEPLPALKDQILKYDVICLVAPIHLQKQVLDLCGPRPLLIVKNDRIFEGNEKVTFRYKYWEQVHKIEVFTSIFVE